MESDAVALRVGSGLQFTLRRLATLAYGIAVVAAVVGAATFATGLWVFEGDGRTTWIIIGGLLCLVPVAAALIAWPSTRHSSSTT